ncbi:RNA polymerase sigma factor RpoD/SigA [bacterium]|nr:RNA polymerase sigma factor RpoD/SigA [bacterium]
MLVLTLKDRQDKMLPSEKSKSLTTYFTEIGRFPLLSRQEELELARRAKGGDEGALNKLVEANLRFVVKIANRYSNQGLPLEDLISAGNEGLIIAVRHFDPERGNRLISYGVWWIRQSISRVLANDSRTIRLPFYIYCDLYRLRKVTTLFRSHNGRAPKLKELSSELGMSFKKIKKLQRVDKSALSLNHPLIPNEKAEMIDVVPDSRSDTPEEVVLSKDQLSHLMALLTRLSERESKIVRMHYGIGQEAMTLREIGEVFDLSRERIRQIEVAAFRKIREMSSTAL